MPHQPGRRHTDDDAGREDDGIRLATQQPAREQELQVALEHIAHLLTSVSPQRPP